jgi:hypothetical protein
MGYLRTALVAAVLTVAFIVPSAASAQVNTVGTGTTAQLGPEGATVIVPVIVNCLPNFVIGSANLGVVQSSGKSLTQGFGGVSTSIACTGTDQTVSVTVTTFSAAPYKQGRASASGSVFVIDPSTGFFVNVDFGPQEIRIRK